MDANRFTTARLATGVSSSVVLALGIAIAGCDDPLAPAADDRIPDVSAYVVGNAFVALNGLGHFPQEAPGDGASVTPTAAVEIAEAVIAQHIVGSDGVLEIAGFETRSWREYLESGHGAPMDWLQSVASRRPYYSHSYIEPLPDHFPPAVRNAFGDQYLVPIHARGIQVAAIAVAAHSRVSVDSNGRITGNVGGDYRPVAVPHGADIAVPLSPESAVKWAVDSLGVRVAEVPRLHRPGNGVAPHHSVWSLEFEREVVVRVLATGVTHRVQVLYLGLYPSFIDNRPGTAHQPRLFVPAPLQPATLRMRFMLEGQDHDVDWPVKSGTPVDFLEVAAIQD